MINFSLINGTLLMSTPNLVPVITDPAQVPQVKNGEQVLQSLSLWS